MFEERLGQEVFVTFKCFLNHLKWLKDNKLAISPISLFSETQKKTGIAFSLTHVLPDIHAAIVRDLRRGSPPVYD